MAVDETARPQNMKSACAWGGQDAINADNTSSENIHILSLLDIVPNMTFSLISFHWMLSKLRIRPLNAPTAANVCLDVSWHSHPGQLYRRQARWSRFLWFDIHQNWSAGLPKHFVLKTMCKFSLVVEDRRLPAICYSGCVDALKALKLPSSI